MARIRTIKPKFFQDFRLARDLDRTQRLLYIGLWTEADDDGRFLAHPGRIKGSLFPYDDDIQGPFIESSLKTLSSTGRLRLYVVDGEPYGQLAKFAKHQKINRPTPSHIPPPPHHHLPEVTDTSLNSHGVVGEVLAWEGRGNGMETGDTYIGASDDAPERESASTESGQEDASGPSPGREGSSGLDVIGRADLPDGRGQGPDGGQGAIWPESSPRRAENPSIRFPAKPRQVEGRYEYPVEFESAWSEYPQREGSNPKVGAYAVWRKRVISGSDPQMLMISARHYREYLAGVGKEGTEFVMQAARFFGPQEPWRDFVNKPTSAQTNGAAHWSETL